MVGEGTSQVGWWADVIALLASLVFAWPVVRTSFRLRRADQAEAPAAASGSHANDVLSRVWAKTASALREPLWTPTDHWATLIAVGLVILATVLKVVSRWL